jgi:hypothetical protein
MASSCATGMWPSSRGEVLRLWSLGGLKVREARQNSGSKDSKLGGTHGSKLGGLSTKCEVLSSSPIPPKKKKKKKGLKRE